MLESEARIRSPIYRLKDLDYLPSRLAKTSLPMFLLSMKLERKVSSGHSTNDTIFHWSADGKS
jgi:hypothetical protein